MASWWENPLALCQMQGSFSVCRRIVAFHPQKNRYFPSVERDGRPLAARADAGGLSRKTSLSFLSLAPAIFGSYNNGFHPDERIVAMRRRGNIWKVRYKRQFWRHP